MSLRRFATYAWSMLAFNVAVILSGAVMRAKDSGAGCGAAVVCSSEVLAAPAAVPVAVARSPA